MEPDAPVPPQALAERLRQALGRRTGEGGDDLAAAHARVAFAEAFGGEPARIHVAPGYVPVIAEHTHYFPGFGLLARLPGTVAVAARPTEGPPRFIAVVGETTLSDRLSDTLRSRGEAGAGNWEVVALSVGRQGGEEACIASVATALLQATKAGSDDARRARLIAEVGQEVLGRPYGGAYALASANGSPLVLVDVASGEHLAIEVPPELGMGLIGGDGRPPPSSAFWERAALAEQALLRLQERGFGGATSLRRLEHRDLPDALHVLSGPARALVRHLVTEDRRVPRLVAALKRGDVQLFGALLLMSQASRRDDEGASTEGVEAVVSAAGEAEGVYGARMAGVGYGPPVLVAGRSFLVPTFLDEAAGRLESLFGSPPDTVVL